MRNSVLKFPPVFNITIMHIIVKLVFLVAVCYGQNANFRVPNPVTNSTGLQKELSEKIGVFSIEMLYHTSQTLQPGQNFVMSPFTVWNVLALIAEGASDNTRDEINSALRLTAADAEKTRIGFRNISRWLSVNTTTIQVAKINVMLMNNNSLPNKDFIDIAREYQNEMWSLDFQNSVILANTLNKFISDFTRGKIPQIVDASYFQDTKMVLTSALYFKGQWSVPFNTSSTTKMPFYDSNGQQIGDVNMMYNRHTYPFSNIKALQARVIELPYGKENRLSMLIMLPNPGVSVEDMFKNFQNVKLDTFFEELRVSKEEYSDDEVDCFIPRFKIKSDIDLTNVLNSRMGINDLFDQSAARLPRIAKTLIYVSKMTHKAEIEVTEEGTEAAAVTVAEFSNRIGVVQFQANRPFTYIIVEKVTNSIVFAGFYKTPSLY